MRDRLSDRSPESYVLKFYLYQALLSQGFIAPIVAEFVLARGVSLAELGTLGATFMAAWTLGEVPTGYVGDRIGRRNSLIAANVLTAAAILGLAFSHSFAAFLALYVLWALGVTFRSGTGSAWLYDILQERLDEGEFAHVKGRGRSIWLAVTAVSSIAGAYLAELAWPYPFYVNAAFVATNVLVLLTFPETEAYKDDDSDAFTMLQAVEVIREQFVRPELRAFVAYTAVFFGLVSVADHFTQPVATSVGVSIAELGWLYAGFNLVAAGVTTYAGTIKDAIGIRTWFLVMPPLVGVAFVAMTFLNLLVVPALFLVKAVNQATMPLKNQYLNDHIESVGRATVLSAASMTGALAAVGFRVAAGAVAEATSPVAMIGVFGGGFVVMAAAILVGGSPVVSPATAGASAD